MVSSGIFLGGGIFRVGQIQSIKSSNRNSGADPGFGQGGAPGTEAESC